MVADLALTLSDMGLHRVLGAATVHRSTHDQLGSPDKWGHIRLEVGQIQEVLAFLRVLRRIYEFF